MFVVANGAAGVTAIEFRMGVIVRLFDPLITPMAAEIVVVPLAMPVARPAAIAATLSELEVHVA